jgi:hypothetical protein
MYSPQSGKQDHTPTKQSQYELDLLDLEKQKLQFEKIKYLEQITDVKLKSALTDQLMNEIQGTTHPQITDKDTPKWSRDIVTLCKDELSKTIDFREAAKLGLYIKKMFMNKYQRVPSKYKKFVNGNMRKVNAYEFEYENKLIKWINKYYSQQ